MMSLVTILKLGVRVRGEGGRAWSMEGRKKRNMEEKSWQYSVYIVCLSVSDRFVFLMLQNITAALDESLAGAIEFCQSLLQSYGTKAKIVGGKMSVEAGPEIMHRNKKACLWMNVTSERKLVKDLLQKVVNILLNEIRF